jgi:hypothetical protein
VESSCELGNVSSSSIKCRDTTPAQLVATRVVLSSTESYEVDEDEVGGACSANGGRRGTRISYW